jgi:uncharacterized protein (TIGR03435 family)
LILIGGALPVTVGLAQSQTKTAVRPEFEVASIKLGTDCQRNRPGPRGPGVSSPGSLQMNCTTLDSLIQTAYVNFANGVSFSPQELEIEGGPDWIRSDQYDLAAKVGGNAHVAQMRGPMLQKLLEDRFQLKIHRETKEGAVYTLTVAKTGLKLRPTKEGSCVPWDPDHGPPAAVPGQPKPCRDFKPEMSRATVTVEAHGMTIADFFEAFSNFFLRQPVIDKTGLAGPFDFHVEFSRDLGLGVGGGKKGGSGDPAPPAESYGPSVPAALQDQLGLKIAPGKGPVQFLVIDHVERPSEN